MKTRNTREGLLTLLNLIDSRLKSDVILVTLGGTALTLLGTKASSIDIDIIVVFAQDSDEFYDVYFSAIKELELLQGEHPPLT